jgi:acyl-CoA thioesterase I
MAGMNADESWQWDEEVVINCDFNDRAAAYDERHGRLQASATAKNMRSIWPIAVFCVLTLCVGCGRNPRISRPTESSVVVAFGDSLTSGTGASRAESYPSMLSKMIGCRVINAGVPGEDSSDGLRRLPTVLEKERPDLVILCHGGNDMLSGQNPDITSANLSAMISMVKNAGSDVVLIGVPKPGLRLRPPRFYGKIAKEYAIPYNPEIVAEILSTPSLKSDQAHPNAAGYRRLAESVAALIRESQRE